MGLIETVPSFLKLINLSSIEQQYTTNRVLFCDLLEERGVIQLKIRRGVIPLPRLIPFNMPQNSKIDEIQNYELIEKNILTKRIEYNEKKEVLRGFINISKTTFYPRIEELSIRYKRLVPLNFLSLIEAKIEVKNEENNTLVVTNVINNSDIEFKRYKVVVRVPLSFYLGDIVDFDEKRLEAFKKEYLRENIEVYDNMGQITEITLGHIYVKDGIRMESDIFWLTNLGMNETKAFKIFVK